MSDCPVCGLPPTAITQNPDKGDEAVDECENGHQWPAGPDEG